MMMRQRVGLLVLVAGLAVFAGCAGTDNAEETTPTPTITNTRGPTNTPTITLTPTEVGTPTPTFTGPPPPTSTPTPTPIVREFVVAQISSGSPTGLFSSLAPGTNTGTFVAAQPFLLAMGPRDTSTGIASLSLQQDAIIGITTIIGPVACIKFFAEGSNGQIDCDGGTDVGVVSTQASGGNLCEGSSGPTTCSTGPNPQCGGDDNCNGSMCIRPTTTIGLATGTDSGPGAGYINLMFQQTDPFQIPIATPMDCFTLDYDALNQDPTVFSHPFPGILTTGPAMGTKGTAMLTVSGQNFDCSDFTNDNGPGQLLIPLYQFVCNPAALGDSVNMLRMGGGGTTP